MESKRDAIKTQIMTIKNYENKTVWLISTFDFERNRMDKNCVNMLI